MEEIDQPPRARTQEAIAYRRRDDCAGIDQDLGTGRAREALLAERVEAVAEGTGSHPKQPAVFFIHAVRVDRVGRAPRQQGRLFRQELPQTFDVIVMDDAAGLGYGPFESSAEA